MKVIQILYSGVGGTSSVAFSLTQGDLNKKWRHVYIFLGKEQLAPGHKELCKKLNINYYNFNLIKNFFLREFLIFYVLLKEKPDGVILHGFNIISIILLKKILFYKTIFVEHTPFAYRNYRNLIIDFFVSKFFDKTVLLTNDYKKKILKNVKNINNKYKIAVVNNGVSPNVYSKPPNLNKKKLVLGMISRFSYGKYQNLLIYSFHKFLRINKNLNLYLVGKGENLKNCKKIVKKLKIQHKVRFLNTLKLSDINRWFKNIDIYVHLSKDEGLSTAILYAIQSERPVIASNNSGNRYLKRQKGNLAVIVENDEKKIIDGLKKIINNRKKVLKMIQRSKKIINKNYSSEIMFKKYFRILNEK